MTGRTRARGWTVAARVALCLSSASGCVGRVGTPPFSEQSDFTLTLELDGGQLEMTVGESVQLYAVPTSADGQVFAGLYTLAWASSATAIASVDGIGVVSALAPGSAAITATATRVDTGRVATATAPLTVGRPGAGVDAGSTGASSLQLSNLPANPTTVTSAAIAYALVPGNSADTVYCRLDSYAPIVCPNPFVLGGSNGPLGAGPHQVDYYVDRGAGIVATAPDVSYCWSIDGVDAGVVAGAVDAGTGATPLPSAFALDFGSMGGYSQPDSFEYEAAQDSVCISQYTDASGQSGSGYSATGYDLPDLPNGGGIATPSVPPLSNLPTFQITSANSGGCTPGVRLGPVTDSSGLSMIRHAVYEYDPFRHNGNRSELAYNGVYIVHGVDYWMAAAWRLDSDWTIASGSMDSSDHQSLLQIHQGNTTYNGGGPFGVQWKGNNPAGAEFSVFTVDTTVGSTTRFTFAANPGGMQRVIVHIREGFAGDNPTIEMWVANGTGGYTRLQDQAPGTNIGDTATSASNPDFAKIGIYKWVGLPPAGYGLSNKKAMNSSGLFFGTGVNLYDNAVAALAPYAVP